MSDRPLISPSDLASDGDDVLPGVEPPTAEELAAHEERAPEEVQAHIAAHIAEVDAWKAEQQ